jgi:hypothetical protein
MTAFDNVPVNEAVGPILHKPFEPQVLVNAVQVSLRGA